MVGLLAIALESGAAGNPPKHPRPVALRQSRRTGRWLWRCAGGGRCKGMGGVGHTWQRTCEIITEHFNNTSHEEK